MSQGNGFSYSPHFKPSAVKRGPSSSYQELSNGYNKLYQSQAYAAMNGAANIPHYPFQQTFVAYPANMMTTNDGENVIGSNMSQDSSSGFAFPIVNTQTLGSPAPEGSSRQQTVKTNHQNSDTTFAAGPQAQMMVAHPSGYIHNTHDFSNKEVAPTRKRALLPGMQNLPGAATPMHALSGNSQPQQATSRLEVHTHRQAIRRPDLTANTQSRASSQPVAHAPQKSREIGDWSSRSLTSSLEEKVKRGDKDDSRLMAIARSKPRAHSALPRGSGYHKQISSSDGRQRILNHIPSQSDASQVTSPPTPVNSETQSSVIMQPSFQGSTYLGGKVIVRSQTPHAHPQAPSASDYKSRTGLPESLKSQRRSLPESGLSSNLPMRNMQLDHSWGEPTGISSPNSHNLQRNLTRDEGLEQDALSANLTSLLGERYSDATVTPLILDPDSNLAKGKLNSQTQRAVGQVEIVRDANATGAAESANGVEIGMEIKETIERMLQYKNMNPILFSKIWVQVKKDQGGQEIEVVGKCNALSNGDRKLNSPIPSQNHPGSRSELSVEPLQQGNLDVGRENSQRRKRKSSEIVSGTSDPRRPDVGHFTPTSTTPHSFAESTKSSHVERSVESPVCNGSLSPCMSSTSHRKLGVQTTIPEVIRAVRPGPTQGAPPPAGTPSTWSKEKKKVLAQALRNKLASISGNASTAITTDEIIRTFNNTPSMTEVRRSLKNRGLNISAEDLYQWWCATLLKYDEKTLSEQQSSKLEGPPLYYSSNTTAPKDLNYDSMNEYTHNSSLSPAMPSLSNRHHHLKEVQKPPSSLSPPPMDGNTRKRSYASVIDLTSEKSPSVIDEIQTSRVGMKMTDSVNLPPSHADAASCYGKPNKTLDQTANKKMKKSPADDKGKDLSHFEYAKSQQDLLHSNIIITPMDVRKALRRSTYNSDSIAKDVLIAAAKHPTEAPLNHHVDALRTKFVYVNSRSDLSTFRWELVDPGPDEQNIPATRSRIADVDDTEEGDLDLLDLRKLASAARHQKEVVAANDRVVRAPNADTTAKQSARGRPPRQEKTMKQRFIGTDTQEGPSNTVVPVAYSDRLMTTDKISKPNRQSGPQAPKGSDATSLARKPKGTADASPDPAHSARASEQRPQALPQGPVRFKPSFARPRDVVARSGSRVREASPVRLEKRMKARLPVSPQNSKPSRSNSLTSRKSYSTPMKPSGLRNFLTPPDGIAVVIQSPPPKTGAVERIPRR